MISLIKRAALLMITSLVFIVVVLSIGCSNTQVNASTEDEIAWIGGNRYWDIATVIYKDTKTDVEYLVFQDSHGITVTPRLTRNTTYLK